MNDTLNKLQFWLTFIFFNVTFMPLFFAGLKGDHRRIFNYSTFQSLQVNDDYRKIASIATIGLVLSQLIFIINLIISLRSPKRSAEAKNPYNANSLEWVAASPPPHGNFEVEPVVYRGAYEYSVPGRKSDFWPQNEAN